MLRDSLSTAGEKPQGEKENLGTILRTAGLSNREIDVVKLVIKGFSNKQVGNELCIAEKTVKFHLTHVYKNLSIKSRAELIVWCFSHLNFVESPHAPLNTSSPVTETIPVGNTTVIQSSPFVKKDDGSGINF